MRKVIAQRGELGTGESKKFLLSCAEGEIECFIVNYEGELHAYVNRCRHVPMTMDWVENRFFSPDGRHILCATHGACYDPRSGDCVAGPAMGQALIAVPLTFEGDEVIAHCPEEE